MSNKALASRIAGATTCCSPLTTEPINEQAAVELSRGFKALADPVRLRLLSLIGAHTGGEVCVCELTDAFDLTQPTISHHLRVLREAGLIASERRGTWVYYWVLPSALAGLGNVLATTSTNRGSAQASIGAPSRPCAMGRQA